MTDQSTASLIPFPPRAAGRDLDRALAAALDAGGAEAARLARPGAAALGPVAEALIEQAALKAALPIVSGLTSDPAMAGIVAHGIAAEVLIRLRKAGAA